MIYDLEPPANAKHASWSAETHEGSFKLDFVFWRSEKWFLGFLKQFPEHWTQGHTQADLRTHLLDIFRTRTSPDFIF